MELSERYIQKLEDEGFSFVYDWHDEPGTVYEGHEHKDKVTLYITDGSIELTMAGETKTLHVHDRIDIPPHTKHSGKVGPSGCGFVVGEMIKGDS